jgi:hypothetical protein
MAQVTVKNSTGRSPFFVGAFFGHVPIEWLKLPLKTAQDARHFLFWCFFGLVPTARLILPLKTGQDARQFCVWRFLAPCRFQMDFSVPK